jgi:hypothetical protein
VTSGTSPPPPERNPARSAAWCAASSASKRSSRSRRSEASAPRAFQDFANELASVLAPNTVRRIMDVVRGVLSLAVARRYVLASAAAGVELEPKGDGVEINPLTHGEVRALVVALPEH